MAASSNAVRRLRHDYAIFCQSQSPQIALMPSSESMLEFHFVLHHLPSDTPYAGGCYHGKILFPEDYPIAPPKIIVLTPNGRLQRNQSLCISMTDFLPGDWTPAWSIETILVGLISFMVDDRERNFVGAEWQPHSVRKRLADLSWSFNAADSVFRELFPELCEPQAVESRSAMGADELAQRISTESDVRSGVEGESLLVGQIADTQGMQEDVLECTFCRAQTEELLIQPCACRGSMAGVHASCLHSWIQHHRIHEQDEGPRCSICQQLYTGSNERPGLTSFLQCHVELMSGCIPWCTNCIPSLARRVADGLELCLPHFSRFALRSVKLFAILTCYLLGNKLQLLKCPLPYANVTTLMLHIIFWTYVFHRAMSVFVTLRGGTGTRSGLLTLFVLPSTMEVECYNCEMLLISTASVCISIKCMMDTLPGMCFQRLPEDQGHGKVLGNEVLMFCSHELFMRYKFMASPAALILVQGAMDLSTRYSFWELLSWKDTFKHVSLMLGYYYMILVTPFLFCTHLLRGRRAVLVWLEFIFGGVAMGLLMGCLLLPFTYYRVWQLRHSRFALYEPLLEHLGDV